MFGKQSSQVDVIMQRLSPICREKLTEAMVDIDLRQKFVQDVEDGRIPELRSLVSDPITRKLLLRTKYEGVHTLELALERLYQELFFEPDMLDFADQLILAIRDCHTEKGKLAVAYAALG